MTAVTIIKRDHAGQETWRYQGVLLDRGVNHIISEAFFDREDLLFHGMTLRRGDRFIETYFADRWYNIFEIYELSEGQLKGWYCNIGHPAEIDSDTISYRDLALDLLVFPDGRQIVLDEDEFSTLPLTPDTRKRALAALDELQRRFRHEEHKNTGSQAGRNLPKADIPSKN